MAKESNIETLALLERLHEEKNPENFELLLQIYERHGKTSPRACFDEIRKDGSNSFAIIFRGGEGVDYDEIVADVAKKIKVPDNEITEDYKKNELLILGKIVADYWSKLPPEERKKIAEHLKKLGNQYFDPKDLLNILKLGGNIVPYLINIVGIQTTQKLMLTLLPEIIGTQVTMQGLRTVVGAFIPALNILMGVWLLNDIAGPAFRKTIPTVATIALLRLHSEE